ncbi:MAG: SCO family protein [Phycisphaerales bacterium]|nr:SCO family protein [Phycisphaerales bacterium]MCB9840251.1 SCO family protein [Phycisphaeraceae bacterium]
MRSLHIIAILIATVGLLVTVALTVAVGMQRPERPDPRAPDQGLESLRIPDFELTDQHGEAATAAILDGHYTVVDFIFTSCPFACPAMMGRMAQVQDSLAGTGVRFASFSLDPQRDTPEALREYLSNYSGDPATWTLLTGDREVVWSIVRDALKFELEDDADTMITGRDGTSMPNIRHPIRFVLVGPGREVLGMYKSDDPESIAALEERVRLLTAG